MKPFYRRDPNQSTKMDKNKFLDKIFEEFERRLTRVIELGYCSLTLEVENSLKNILSKTINSSAGIQTKVLKEITTMKEYVVEVVSEDNKSTEGSTDEDVNVQLPIGIEDEINSSLEKDIKAESIERKTKKEGKTPGHAKSTLAKDDTSKTEEEESTSVKEKVFLNNDVSMQHESDITEPLKASLKEFKTKNSATNKIKRKSKHPSKQVEIETSFDKEYDNDFAGIQDVSSSKNIKSSPNKKNDDEINLTYSNDVGQQHKSILLSDVSKKVDHNDIEEMEMDAASGKRTKTSKLIAPKSKKSRNNPLTNAHAGGFDDELEMAIRLSMNPTEQSSKEVQDYVSACTKSMQEPVDSVAEAKIAAKEKVNGVVPKASKNIMQQIPSISNILDEIKGQVVSKPKTKPQTVKKTKRKKGKKSVGYGKKGHKKIKDLTDRAFKCTECDYSSDKKGTLLLHKYNIHNQKDNDETKDDVKDVEEEKDDSFNVNLTNEALMKSIVESLQENKRVSRSAKKNKVKSSGKKSNLNAKSKNKNKRDQDEPEIICL